MATTPEDPYQFSMDDWTPRTRSTSRQRKPVVENSKNQAKKPTNKRTPREVQERIITRSSQRQVTVTSNDQEENSFMSNINTGFSQFVPSTNQSKKRQREREDKKTNQSKRSRVTTSADENVDDDDEIRAIEQIKLVYETSGGRTNLARAAASNAQILANRAVSTATTIRRPPPLTDATFVVDTHNQRIHDSMANTLIVPDTLMAFSSQEPCPQNESSSLNDNTWQRDIDRLMRKLEEPPSPSSSDKSPGQIEETQQEENLEPMHLDSHEKCPEPSLQTLTTTTAIQIGEIGVQTENSSTPLPSHNCCQDVSVCPCVLKYSKMERLFMEKISRLINVMPATTNSRTVTTEPRVIQRRKVLIQHYSRLRQIRGRRRRRVNNRMAIPAPPVNDETTVVEEIDDEVTTEVDEEEQQAIVGVQQEPTMLLEPPPSLPAEEEPVGVVSTTITLPQNTSVEDQQQLYDEVSSIEMLQAAAIADQSTRVIDSTASSINSSTSRRLVLTASSLDENQKSQFRAFVLRFGALTSLVVDGSTTHVIVCETSPLVSPLTGKVIQGIARHLFIMSYRWLDECLSQNTLVDERPFEIRGDSSLGADHGGMRRSRLTPTSTCLLLDQYAICLRCSITDCAPLQSIEQVQQLIQLCGARLVTNFSDIRSVDRRQMVLVVGINGLLGGEKKRRTLLETCQQFNVRCVNIHWLLISIAKFDVQPLDAYEISI